MKVDLKLSALKPFKEGDLLICNGNNEFIAISKEELLRDLKKELQFLKDENKAMKQFLKVYQSETTKLLKGVVFNG